MRSYSAGPIAANAQGTAELDFTPPPGRVWLVQHIAVSSSSTLNCTCSVYKNQQFICGTNIGTADSADGNPVPIRATDQLRLVWAGCNSGAQCSCLILVDEDTIGGPLLQSARGT